MDEQQHDADEAVRERARWLHDMRNAVNTAGVAVALSKRLTGRGETAAAMEMLDTARESWGPRRDLLVPSPGTGHYTSQDEADRLLRPHGATAPAQHAPPTRR